MKTVILAICLVVLAAPPASAQKPDGVKRAGNELKFRVIPRFDGPANDTIFPHAKPAIDAGDWDDAWDLLKAAQTPDSAHKFLKGYVALQSKQPEALALLEEASKDDAFILRGYAARFAAEAASSQANWQAVLDLTQNVSAGLPVADDAQWLAIDAMQQLQKQDGAILALSVWIDKHPHDSRIPAARVQLADLLMKSAPERAAQVAYQVLIDDPLDALASQARARVVTATTALPEAKKAQFALDSMDIRLARWRAMYRRHQSQGLVDELSKTADKLPAEHRCEGQFLVAHSLTKLRKHAESVPWYAKIISQCDKGDWRLRSLYLGGKARWNAGKLDQARVWFEKLWTDFPTHSYADDAMYFAARILQEQGNTAAAAKLVQRQLEEYPEGDMASDAFWLEIRRSFEKHAYVQVVRQIDALKHTNEGDLYSRGRLAYFRARALQRAGKTDEAATAFGHVISAYPMSYYALLAFQRLGPGDGPWVCPGIVACDVTTSAFAAIPKAPQDPAYDRAALLLQMGLATLARPEILRLESSNASDPNMLWFLADRLDRAGAYTLSHDIARRKILGWDQTYPDPLQRRNWEIAFPRPFDETVRAYAAQRKIPAALIWAIMREESGFNPRIESWANARGLLQLMESTAKAMATLDATRVTTAQLFDPQTNIRLGSRYLQELGEDVGYHPVLMIAGYNGGMGNVEKWLRDSDSKDLDLFVEDIPFGQTRNYTKRVLLSFWVYTWLYADGKVPRFPMRLPR